MKIFTDASSDNGTLGAGCVLVSDDNRLLGSFGSSFFTGSVNFAELYAVYTAIRYVAKIAGENELNEVRIFSDSESILRRIKSYVNCLSKTQQTLSHKDKKFLNKLETNCSPFQKRVLSEIMDLFEQNKDINFSLIRVQGHQKPKNNPRTEEEYNGHWNIYADRFANRVRLVGEERLSGEAEKDISVRKEIFIYEEVKAGVLDREIIEGKGSVISKFLSTNDTYSIRNVGDKGGSFKNVAVSIVPSGEEEPKKKEKKENRAIRTLHHQPRRISVLNNTGRKDRS